MTTIDIPLFNFLSSSDKELFLKHLQKKEHKKGEVLYKEGTPIDRLFIIEKGLLHKLKKEGPAVVLQPGATTGLLHFFRREKSTSTLEVAEDSVLLEIDSQTFRKLLSESSSLNDSYITFLNSKLLSHIHALHKLKQQASGQTGLKLAFFATQPYMKEAFEQIIKEKNYDINVTWFEERLTKNTVSLAMGYKAVCCFVSDVVDADVISRLAESGVKMIAMRCAGIDNVDLEAAKKHSISLTRVPAYSPYAVAEFAVTLMLSLNRKIVKASRRVKELNFSLSGLVGFDMYGKTVGVLGTGKIGKIVIDILTGFGCNILASDVVQNPELKDRKNVKYVEKDELYKNSDIISIHAPLLKDTYHMINEQTIKLMKPGVIIVNTSRGGLVDSNALLNGILQGKIGAAGLDVVEGEKGIFYEDWSDQPSVENETLTRLISCNNVLVTSHQAFLTREALRNIAVATLESLAAFKDGKKGKELPNVVQEAL